jgi:hypothetical protein
MSQAYNISRACFGGKPLLRTHGDRTVQWYSVSDPISITNLVLGVLDRGIKVLGWLSKKLGGKASAGPGTIAFVPQRHTWHLGGVDKEKAMQLMSDWWMTNDTQTHVFILRAELRYRMAFARRF